MNNILEKLWDNYIYPNEMCLVTTPEEKTLTSHATRHFENLTAALTEEQQILLEEYINCESKRLDIREREIFVYAFRLGAQLTLESMQPNCKK